MFYACMYIRYYMYKLSHILVHLLVFHVRDTQSSMQSHPVQVQSVYCKVQCVCMCMFLHIPMTFLL